ncbi:MAG: ATP-binding protein [candidate division Zixibacteria bacterium]
MKIRSKLLFYYGLIIAAFLAASAISISAVSGWSNAADRLIETHSKSAVAERLRSNIFLQVNFALDYLYGDSVARERFEETQRESASLIDRLKTDSLAENETYFIEGFEETQYELTWIMDRFFANDSKPLSGENFVQARERLREMADEVAGDVTALSRYYYSQEDLWLKAATDAGGLAVGIIITTSIVAIVLFIILAFFLQRWLVKPIALVNDATKSISDGNLDIRIDLKGNDEWAQVADAIGDMADSLKSTLQKLSDHERLAAIGEISAYAAHNIRNPLSGIRAAVQVLLSDTDSLPDSAVESLDDIIKTVDRLDGWLKGLLQFAKPLDYIPEKRDINELLTEAVSIASKTLETSSTKLDWRLAENIPPIEVDSILLEQAIVVIVTNAFQAISDDGRISLKTAYQNLSDGESVSIIITDNGIGVPNHIKPRLFKIFESSKAKGTGLGLAQAKRIIDIHQGRINLESEPGKGTTVEILLPLRKSTNDKRE